MMAFPVPSMTDAPVYVDGFNSQAREIAIYAERYAWLRQHPAFETEALLAGLSPEEFDALVDKAMKVE